MKQIINITSNGIKQAIDDLVNENKRLQDKVYKLEDIIKEVREYIENNNLYEQDYTYDYEENIEEWPPDDTKARKELLEILNKENKE